MMWHVKEQLGITRCLPVRTCCWKAAGVGAKLMTVWRQPAGWPSGHERQPQEYPSYGALGTLVSEVLWLQTPETLVLVGTVGGASLAYSNAPSLRFRRSLRLRDRLL